MEIRSAIYRTIAKYVKKVLTLVDVRLNEIAVFKCSEAVRGLLDDGGVG